MKTNKIFLALSLIVSIGLMTQCEKWGGRDSLPDADDDSDRPEWAGGNTDANDNIKGNDNSGTTRGGDYGDLYVLRRDLNGVPVMTWVDLDGDEFEDEGEHFVQPIDALGNDIELDEFGELPEGAPVIEVDFGRLNIVRSPTSVLDQALVEALKTLNPVGVTVDIDLDFCGRLTAYTTEGVFIKTIDSPRENMAIYRTIMQDLTDSRLAFLWLNPNLDPLTVAASCFAAGSDKTGTVDIDEVVYINGFMDCEGLNPIPNENEYDFNNDNKWYFNFGDCLDPENCDPIQTRFQYNRDLYKDRYLRILVLDGVGNYTYEIKSVYDAMEDGGLFTARWGVDPFLTHVEGFACAIDDAVQVLDYVHGDSNMEFLPDYDPNNP